MTIRRDIDNSTSFPNPFPDRQKSIEVILPGERFGESAFTFKVPARDNLVASANRLLRFEMPPQRDPKVFERLIKTNVVSAGVSKKTLGSLPFPFLEMIYARLWEQAFGARATERDVNLGLYLLAEESTEFRLEEWVRQDIRLMGLHEAGPMHSYYYEGPLDREQMRTFLAEQGYRTDLLDGADSEEALQLAYLACRRLTRALPWSALLAELTPAELLRYPRLARLQAIQTFLANRLDTVVTAESLPATMSALKNLSESPPLQAVSAETGVPRSVRTLVIVEGETEKMLLPLFAESMGLDFCALGVDVWPAGGKNNVAAIYRENARNLAVPICIVLDNDAAAIAAEIEPELRPGDWLFSIPEGEFEDLYDLDLILKTINRNYQPYPALSRKGFQDLGQANNARGRVQALKAVWQSYGLGSFDKIDFAVKYAEAFRATDNRQAIQPPPPIRQLIETILRVREAGVR